MAFKHTKTKLTIYNYTEWWLTRYSVFSFAFVISIAQHFLSCCTNPTYSQTSLWHGFLCSDRSLVMHTSRKHTSDFSFARLKLYLSTIIIYPALLFNFFPFSLNFFNKKLNALLLSILGAAQWTGESLTFFNKLKWKCENYVSIPNTLIYFNSLFTFILNIIS